MLILYAIYCFPLSLSFLTFFFRFYETVLSSSKAIVVHLVFLTPFYSPYLPSFLPFHPQLNNVRLLDKTIKKKYGLSILITVIMRSPSPRRAVLPWLLSPTSLVTISTSPSRPIAFSGSLGSSASCLLKPFPVGISDPLFHCRRVFLAGGSAASRQFHPSPAVRRGVESVPFGTLVAQTAIVLRPPPRGSVPGIELCSGDKEHIEFEAGFRSKGRKQWKKRSERVEFRRTFLEFHQFCL